MTASSGLNDDQLMRLICAGDHDAFAKLVGQHTQRFFSLAFYTLQHRSDAEDVVQGAFVKLWQKPDAWQPQKSRFTTWFYRVILNACYDHQRKAKRLVNFDQQALEGISEPGSSEQSRLEQQQILSWQQANLETAIAKLPASQRDALNLVVYSELPQKQAAQVMGVSLKALESLLVRAKRSVRKTIEQTQASESLPKVAEVE